MSRLSERSAFSGRISGNFLIGRPTVNFDELFGLIEALRTEAIGEPKWDGRRRVYEYEEHTTRVVAVLKLIRAAHGLRASEVLRAEGHFFDLGMISRGVFDAVEEIYFLLEKFPESSAHVDQFVKGFFESTIDGHLSAPTKDVVKGKIRAARVRYLADTHDQKTQDMLERIFKTYSGYVHAKYSHIMEVFGGRQSFNLCGVPSAEQKAMRAEHIKLMASSVAHAAHFVAYRLGLTVHQNAIFAYTQSSEL